MIPTKAPHHDQTMPADYTPPLANLSETDTLADLCKSIFTSLEEADAKKNDEDAFLLQIENDCIDNVADEAMLDFITVGSPFHLSPASLAAKRRSSLLNVHCCRLLRIPPSLSYLWGLELL